MWSPMGEATIRIPAELYEKAKKFIEESQGEFKSVDELVTFILEEFFKEEETEGLSPEEEEKIKERLRSLGYI